MPSNSAAPYPVSDHDKIKEASTSPVFIDGVPAFEKLTPSSSAANVPHP